jgi:hypothetical protein
MMDGGFLELPDCELVSMILRCGFREVSYVCMTFSLRTPAPAPSEVSRSMDRMYDQDVVWGRISNSAASVEMLH